jgi:cysteine desulfurase
MKEYNIKILSLTLALILIISIYILHKSITTSTTKTSNKNTLLIKPDKPIIYLDNNGTTRIFDETLIVMDHIYKYYYGNASGVYKLGSKSKKLLEDCRSNLAGLLHCEPCEVFFTSGATESNNLAIRGIYAKHKERGKHVITTTVEHPSITETVLSLEGADVTFLAVDKYGKIDIKELQSSIRKDTVLVTVIMGNNEIGTIQDIRAISKVCKQKDVHFHCDMTQIIGKYNINLKDLGVDSATGSGHKFHGPKATGFLYLKTNAFFETCVTGGGQEKNIRAGTENIPGIVGMCHSLAICNALLKQNHHIAIKEKRDWIKQTLEQRIPNCIINGHPTDMMYNTLSICLPVNSRKVIMKLDEQDICVNTGSACSKGHSSKVLTAIGLPKEKQDGSMRISLSFMTTWEECKIATHHIIKESHALLWKSRNNL